MIRQWVQYKGRKRPGLMPGTKIGLMTAEVRDGSICIGWASWHPKKDPYSLKKIERVAIGRMRTDNRLIRTRIDEDGKVHDPVASYMREPLNIFIRRAAKYFKGANLSQRTVDLASHIE